MAFSIEVKPQGETTGKVVHTVIVTIDDHETVLTFESKEDAERFVQAERARLTDEERPGGAKQKSAPGRERPAR
jgi:hypothetical protein